MVVVTEHFNECAGEAYVSALQMDLSSHRFPVQLGL